MRERQILSVIGYLMAFTLFAVMTTGCGELLSSEDDSDSDGEPTTGWGIDEQDNDSAMPLGNFIQQYTWMNKDGSDRGTQTTWYRFRDAGTYRVATRDNTISAQNDDRPNRYKGSGSYSLTKEGVVEWTPDTERSFSRRRLTAVFFRAGEDSWSKDFIQWPYENSPPRWIWPTRGFMTRSSDLTRFTSVSTRYDRVPHETEEKDEPKNTASEWVAAPRIQQTVTFESPPLGEKPCRLSVEVEITTRINQHSSNRAGERASAQETFSNLDCNLHRRETAEGYLLEIPAIEKLDDKYPWRQFLRNRELNDKYPYDLWRKLAYSTFSGTFLLTREAGVAALIPSTASVAFVSAPLQEFP